MICSFLLLPAPCLPRNFMGDSDLRVAANIAGAFKISGRSTRLFNSSFFLFLQVAVLFQVKRAAATQPKQICKAA